MANELDSLDSQEIAPYDPGMSPLAPLSPTPDTWGNTGVDLLHEQPRQPQTPTIFGAAMPAGTSKAQIDTVLGQLAGAFMADLSSLGYPAHMVNAAIGFMTENATKAPYQVQVKHRFNLHGHEDWLGNSFANMVQQLSGSAKAKQGFVTACLQWLAKACKQLSPQQVGTQAQGSAPRSTEAMLNSLSDADYDKVIKINEQALARTMQVLQQRWGDYTYQQNIQIAQDYLSRLPDADQRHFDKFTAGYIHMRNTPEFIIAMFDAATGAHNLPKSGAGIAQEIAECEKVMRTNRKQWVADSALQARYRTLLDMKSRGN
jgi:hypothetical protein